MRGRTRIERARHDAVQCGACRDLECDSSGTPLKGVQTHSRSSLKTSTRTPRKAGLTAAGLRTAAEQPVRDGLLRLADPVTDTTSATLDVTVTVVHPNDSLCAAFVDVQLYDVTYFVPSYGQYPDTRSGFSW